MPPTNTVPRQRSILFRGTAEKDMKSQSMKGAEKSEEDHGFLPQQRFSPTVLLLVRSICIVALYLCYMNVDTIQGYIDSSWSYLRDQWWIQTVYFETLLVVVFSFPSTLTFQILDKIQYFDKYRIEPKGGRIISESISALAYHSVEYILPLALLDTFHVKQYYGVSDDVIIKKRENWIQRTRALPEFAPRIEDIALHILVAIVIYDVLFFIVHYNLHKNQTLYRIFHKKHHTHDVINAKVTDHQHWFERVVFILCANAGLKVQGAHPYTRIVFVFIFVCLLLYNHAGYDFPWALDKIVPYGICSGARHHYVHHEKGKRYYQFIFTYLDKTLDWWMERRKYRRPATA